MQMRFLLLALVGPLIGQSACSASESDFGKSIKTIDLVDTVWAGHPVDFDLEVTSDTIYVAYFDADRHLTIASRPTAGGSWSRFHPPGREVPGRDHKSHTLGWDSHNGLDLAIDSEGHLHLSGNMHVDPLIYYRTTTPGTIDSLERLDRMTGERESRCTYPLFFHDRDGTLLFRYRDGQSGDGADLYNRYDSLHRSWSRLLDTPLHDGEGARNAYTSLPQLGPDGNFHLLWVWRENFPDVRMNNSLSYARSPDLRSWQSASGNNIALPITRSRGDPVDPSGTSTGLINGNPKLGFDSKNRPCAAYHRYDAEGNSQIYLARFENDQWHIRQLTDWTFRWNFEGAGSIPGEVYVGPPQAAPDGSITLRYWAKAIGHGRLTLDESSLEVTGNELPAEPTHPIELTDPRSGPDYKTHLKEAQLGDRRFLLRWETLRSNRDRPRSVTPPPGELLLLEFANSAQE